MGKGGLRGIGETARGERKTALPSQDAHTPGRWVVHPARGDYVCAPDCGDEGDIVCDAPPDAMRYSRARWAANARLIAAAPELLAALEPFAEIAGEGSDDFGDDTPVTIKFGRTTHYALTLGDLRRVQAAISKAEGRE